MLEKMKNGGIEMEKIIMVLYAVLCGGLGIVATLYFLSSVFLVLGQKIYRKVKFGKSLYD